jgi:hypothetical protein
MSPLAPSTCQPLLCAHLAKVVGEVTGTPRVRNFGTLKDLSCSIVERPKGPKDRSTWKAYETLGVRDSVGLLRGGVNQ